MKHFFRLKAPFHLMLVCVVIFAAGCGVTSATGRTNAASSPEGDGTVVLATVYPVYFFASEIMGDKGEVYSLIPPGGEPHHWEPSPGDLVKLNRADMLIYNGAGMEPWLDDILQSVNDDLKAVDSSEGIDLLRVAEAHRGQEESKIDPHVWMDPLNAVIMVENITRALCEVDPGNAPHFRRRGNSLVTRLKKLDRDFSRVTGKLMTRQVVVSHAAFGYLTGRYGLEQLAVRGLSADAEPGPAKLAEIIKTVQKKKIRSVYFESLISPDVIETIARETGARARVLYSLGGISAENLEAGEDYFTLMNKNLMQLKEGLGTGNE